MFVFLFVENKKQNQKKNFQQRQIISGNYNTFSTLDTFRNNLLRL